MPVRLTDLLERLGERERSRDDDDYGLHDVLSDLTLESCGVGAFLGADPLTMRRVEPARDDHGGSGEGP